MNIIARLEYELAYYDSAVHRFNHYTTRTPHLEMVSSYLSRASVAHGWVLDGSRCRTVAQTRLTDTKMPWAPLGFPKMVINLAPSRWVRLLGAVNEAPRNGSVRRCVVVAAGLSWQSRQTVQTDQIQPKYNPIIVYPKRLVWKKICRRW